MVYSRPQERGLIHGLPKWSSQKRCDRCDFLLINSKWNGVKVIYSTSTHTNRGYLCIQCATRPAIHGKNKATPEELDAFTRKYPEHQRKYTKKHKEMIKVPIIS